MRERILVSAIRAVNKLDANPKADKGCERFTGVFMDKVQREIVRYYCVNDLCNSVELYSKKTKPLSCVFEDK